MITRICSIVLLLFLAGSLRARPAEEMSEFQRDGTHTLQRQIRDGGKLLYSYTLETDSQTKTQIREVHSFYMSGVLVLSIVENEKRRTFGHRPGPQGSVVHTIQKDRNAESVWINDHAVENGGWMYVREGDTRHFSYSPSFRELDEELKK